MRLILVVLISVYRALPWRPGCPREGKSCSQLGLEAVKAGLGVTGVLGVLASCRPGDQVEPGQCCTDLTDPCVRVPRWVLK